MVQTISLSFVTAKCGQNGNTRKGYPNAELKDRDTKNYLVLQGVSLNMKPITTAAARQLPGNELVTAQSTAVAWVPRYVGLSAEPEGSTQLLPKPAIGYDPEPDPSSSHPHNLSP
jgi:hypothetical protein